MKKSTLDKYTLGNLLVSIKRRLSGNRSGSISLGHKQASHSANKIMRNFLKNKEVIYASNTQSIFKNSSIDMGTIKSKKSFSMNRWIFNYAFVALSLLVGSVQVQAQCPTSATLTLGDRPCGATATGSATVAVSGGSGTFTYSWTKDGVSYAASPSSAPTNLSAGVYIVTVTDPVNSCSVVSSSLTVSSAVSISLVSAAQNASILCNGQSTASVSGIIQGGTAPRTLQLTKTTTSTIYSSSTPTANLGGGQFSFEVTGLPAGIYSVLVFDGVSSCVASGSGNITISEPTAISATSTPVDACYGLTNGSISVSASGGTGAYT